MAKKKNKNAATDKSSVRIAKKFAEKDNTDVLGSYTGVPADSTEKPVQDADDL